MTTALQSDRSFDSINTRHLAKQLTIVGQALADLADSDDRIVAASADLKFSTLMSEFEDRHPDRFFQFGISERNMMGAAAGMASMGLRPYVATFASFAGLLCYENIRTDLAYPDMPVRVLATHAGISMGFFATSHHATEDISALRSVANLTVLSPADGTSAAALIAATVDHPGPVYFRLSRGREETLYDDGVPASYVPGQPYLVRSGTDVLIVATGLMVRNAVVAADALRRDGGLSATVLDVHTLKPFDAAALARHAAGHRAVVVVEEHNVEGGLGSMVVEAVAEAGLGVPVYKHGLYDEFCIIGPPHHCYLYYGLDEIGIATVARRVCELVDTGRFYERDRSQPLWTDTDRGQVQDQLGVS
jgi:transketolase